jgi:Fe-S cluster assembly ATP-binding protein
MFQVNDLHCVVEPNLQILKGLNLKVQPGEIHAIMGPNGSGKSTLSKVIAGHPDYAVTQGQVLYKGNDIAEVSVTERALQGIFIGFQYPTEVNGVNNADFLKIAINERRKFNTLPEIQDEEFYTLLQQKMKILEMEDKYKERALNVGFSGGEKKRNEILQLLMLNPELAVLDETDSGLDIDALRIVSQGINQYMNQEKAVILITHYQRLLDLVKPHYVHVLRHGKIIESGGPELALELEKKGYDWLEA